KIFNKSASEMMRIINQGSKGIEAFREKMAANGMGFTSAEAEQVRQANIALKSLDRTMTMLKQNLAISLAPVVSEAAAGFTGLGVSAHEVQNAMFGAAAGMAITAAAAANLAAGNPAGALEDVQNTIAFFERAWERLQKARNAPAPRPGGNDFAFELAEK